MTKIPYEMTCEEKVRFWKEAAWFWRKETEQMERTEKNYGRNNRIIEGRETNV